MPEGSGRKKYIVRRLLAAVAALLLLLGTVAFFLPYLLKRYIERHSVEWIGRRVTIGDIILNPFTYTYAVHGVKCYEPGSSEVFVSWKSISVKSDLWAGFRNNKWRFRKLRIEQPYFHLVQHGDRFNFSDLLELGGSAEAKPQAEEKPVLFSMEDILLDGGRITYASDILKAPVGISELRANCTRITSESARMDFGVGFAIDGGGTVQGTFKIDTEKSRYGINAALSSFSLPLLLPYLQDLMHTTGLKGALDLGLHLEDSWADTTALAAAGHLAVHGLEDDRWQRQGTAGPEGRPGAAGHLERPRPPVPHRPCVPGRSLHPLQPVAGRKQHVDQGPEIGPGRRGYRGHGAGQHPRQRVCDAG